jgi:hypothetical protein
MSAVCTLRPETFETLAKTSFTASMTLDVPAGSYTVRAVAQDGLDGKLSAASGMAQVK